jgi:hypothetical protein
MRSLAAISLLALAVPAAAQEGCPKYDAVVDASSAEVASKAEVTGWAKQALKARYEEGAPCFLFVALVSAENATAMYASLRATSREGERVVLAETQTVATGAKAIRKNKLRKELAGWVAEQGKAAAGPAASEQR